jgi:hypothetical protein
MKKGQGKTKETTTTTKKSQSTNKSNKSEGNSAVTSTKTSDNLKEGDKCSFKGLMPDKENCASKT